MSGAEIKDLILGIVGAIAPILAALPALMMLREKKRTRTKDKDETRPVPRAE